MKINLQMLVSGIKDFAPNADIIGSSLEKQTVKFTTPNYLSGQEGEADAMLGMSSNLDIAFNFKSIANLIVEEGSTKVKFFKKILADAGLTLQEAQASEINIIDLLTSATFKVKSSKQRSFDGVPSHTVKSFNAYPDFADDIKNQSMDSDQWAELRASGLIANPVPVYEYTITNLKYTPLKAPKKAQNAQAK
jgi:hypothetical protein